MNPPNSYRAPTCRATLDHRLVVVALLAVGVCFTGSNAHAAGFEVPENTTKSLARGGTGVVNKRDPSALYFNPALLPRADGFQALIDVNLVNLNLTFQRDDLVYEQAGQEQRQSFDPVENEAGFFPAPFLALSWDMGLDNFGVGAGIFGPSAYGSRCYGEKTDEGCEVDRDGAARHMLVDSELLEFYITVGAGLELELPAGSLSLGVASITAYQDNSFSVVINSEVPPSPPWEEKPSEEAVFRGNNLSDWNQSVLVGLAYDYAGVRLGASYRPPMRWNGKGTAETEFSEDLASLEPTLTDDTLYLQVAQAGSLRLGVGYEAGGDVAAGRPTWDVEFNFTWEDWSRTDAFIVSPMGDIETFGSIISLNTIRQEKHWQDSYSYRLGGSYRALDWLVGHAGGYYETGAQPEAYTNVDFVSWDRLGLGAGASFEVGLGGDSQLEIDIGYLHVLSPDRTVTDGEVYQPIPLSACTGPDYQEDACQEPGTPNGTPQNEGTWSSSFQTASIGLTYRYD